MGHPFGQPEQVTVETRRFSRKVSHVSNDSTPSGNDAGTTDSPVEVTDSAREVAAEMARSYEDRPTAVLPGSHNTVAGTAVNEWLDDEGNPKYGKDEHGKQEAPES